MWRSNDYLSIHDAYDWRDGGKACVLYAFTMLALFVQGRLYLSPLSLEVLGSLNILRPLVVLVVTLAVVFADVPLLLCGFQTIQTIKGRGLSLLLYGTQNLRRVGFATVHSVIF